MQLVRGTTPTIRYTFNTVDTSNLTVAKLRLEQGNILIEKDLTDGSVGEGYIEWTLSQEETLSFCEKKNCLIKLDWKLQDGTRGIGTTKTVDVISSAYDEVL